MININFIEKDIDYNNPKQSYIVNMNNLGNYIFNIETPIINPYDLLIDGNIIVECEIMPNRKTLIFFSIVLNKQTTIKRDFYNKIYPELLLMGFPVFSIYGLDISFKKSKKNGYNVFKNMIQYIINSYIKECTGIDFNSNIELDIYNEAF